MTVTQERPRLAPGNVAPLALPTIYPLHVIGEPALAFSVRGVPAPQGSKAYKGMRKGKDGKSRPVLAESSKKVAPWRKAVADVAKIATLARAGWEPLTGPLLLDMVFTLPRPQSFPANDPTGRRATGMPTTYPDVSKLARSTEDAMTHIVWNDDAQIIDYRRLAKWYVGAHDPDVLRAPGAVIRVWRMPESVIASHALGTAL